MAYRDAASGGKARWIGLGALLLVIGAGALWAHERSRPPTTREIEAMLVEDQRYRELFQVLQQGYPAEFRKLSLALTETAQRDRSPRALADRVASFLDTFDESGAMAAARRAPHAEFTRLRQAEIALLDRLGTVEPNACVSWFLGNSIRFADPEAGTELLLTQMWTEKLRAAAAGRDTPVAHVVTPPTNKEWAEIGELMIASGERVGDLQAFADPARIARSDPRDLCRTVVHFLRAIDRLPPERATRFYLGTVGGGAQPDAEPRVAGTRA